MIFDLIVSNIAVASNVRGYLLVASEYCPVGKRSVASRGYIVRLHTAPFSELERL